MTRIDANKVVADALRELADATRARTAFFDSRRGLYNEADDEKKSEWSKLSDRVRDAENRLVEVALGLFPPPRARARRTK